MKDMVPVGIDTMGFYVPPLSVDVSELVKQRVAELPELADTFRSAMRTTGQRIMRITRSWQDSVCLAAEAVLDLARHISFDVLRFLVSASETPVDASKPISAFLLGILEKAGIDVPKNIVNYQTQHACAAGAISLLQVASMIASSKKQSTAIVTASDIARYKKNSTAEITQGSGAVALYLSRNPRFLELDIENVGYFSSDVDDFFRPVHSRTARVRGQYSMQCYNIATMASLENLASQLDKNVEELLAEADYIVFHVPFYSMPRIALKYILRKIYKHSLSFYENFLIKKHVHESSEPIAYLGNTYTASTFFSLGSVIEKHYREGKNIVGKKILIVSYGSGNTCVALKGITTEHAEEAVSTWNLSEQLRKRRLASSKEYDSWMNDTSTRAHDDGISKEDTDAHVYLSHLREDDYRVYDVFPRSQPYP